MNNRFQLISEKTPKGDQIKAIADLSAGIVARKRSQVLLGATGTGKTFTIANVIQNTQKKALILAHNKTLAGQLYNELKTLFPNNKVEYFISYFDFYQPEAYLPSKDTFIEKTSVANETIEMMRLSTLTSLVTRNDVIVVASVACIYPTHPPDDFAKYRVVLKQNSQEVSRKQLIEKLVQLGYENNSVDLTAGKFRVKGDTIEIVLSYTDDFLLRVSYFGNEVEEIATIHPLNHTVIARHDGYIITPASEYLLNSVNQEIAIKRIEAELKERQQFFLKQNLIVEENRITQRTNHDLAALRELGFCSGIENYSFHLELRQPQTTPYNLFDYFGDDWLLVIDESHMTIPQVRGMFNTDKSRKTVLVDHGFRLPSALENRPLNFEEFQAKFKQVIYVSATPNDWEIAEAHHQVVEQIVRPTGLIDPKVIVRTSIGQIDDLVSDLKQQVIHKERTLVTVLTIRMAEELTEYLKEQKFKVAYLHNELKTLERDRIINDLRRGVYDVVVGINLLREGLDLPEVSLVCIFDANKPGFFRSDKALVQIIGRAARNVKGRVVMYADTISVAMATAIKETNRRREIQIAYNKKHNIIPQTIIKEISENLDSARLSEQLDSLLNKKSNKQLKIEETLKLLKDEMHLAANNQEYERAAYLRDTILEIQTNPDYFKKNRSKNPLF